VIDEAKFGKAGLSARQEMENKCQILG